MLERCYKWIWREVVEWRDTRPHEELMTSKILDAGYKDASYVQPSETKSYALQISSLLLTSAVYHPSHCVLLLISSLPIFTLRFFSFISLFLSFHLTSGFPLHIRCTQTSVHPMPSLCVKLLFVVSILVCPCMHCNLYTYIYNVYHLFMVCRFTNTA